MANNLPFLQDSIEVVSETRRPTIAFRQWWQSVVKTIQQLLVDIQTNIEAIEAALAAANIAIAAAEDAQDAADAAQAAADSAQGTGDEAEAIASLTNSGVSGCTITATDAGSDATISISSHTRIYGNGDTVSVNSGSITSLAYSTLYYIYYVDVPRTGGAVTYQATTNEVTAAQVGDTHFVGRVTTPAAAAPDTNGEKPAPPGQGGLEP